MRAGKNTQKFNRILLRGPGAGLIFSSSTTTTRTTLSLKTVTTQQTIRLFPQELTNWLRLLITCCYIPIAAAITCSLHSCHPNYCYMCRTRPTSCHQKSNLARFFQSWCVTYAFLIWRTDGGQVHTVSTLLHDSFARVASSHWLTSDDEAFFAGLWKSLLVSGNAFLGCESHLSQQPKVTLE